MSPGEAIEFFPCATEVGPTGGVDVTDQTLFRVLLALPGDRARSHVLIEGLQSFDAAEIDRETGLPGGPGKHAQPGLHALERPELVQLAEGYLPIGRQFLHRDRNLAPVVSIPPLRDAFELGPVPQVGSD